VVVLCNAATANPVALARSVADVYLGDRLERVPEPPAARVTLTRAQIAPLAGVYANPVTGAPLFITLRGDALVVGRTAGPALVPLAERRFRVAGQPVELEFTPEGVVQTVLGWPRRTPVTLTRHEPARPSRAELERYAGTYHSEELGTTYTVAATDSTLVLRTRWAAERTVRPAYGDTFSGDFLLAFTRGRGGITGMRMSTGRVRNVAFEKVRR
jgi:hypothetical protein